MNDTHAAAGQRLTWDALVRNFAPGWFAAVMGTGVLAITLQAYAPRVEFLSTLATMLHWANLALAAVLAVPWLARWASHTDAALASLRHPVQAHFYPTFSIALVVLSLQLLVFGRHVEIALALWIAGTALTLLFSFAILAIVFHGDTLAPEHLHPGMFIPPVGLVVIPVSGAALAGAGGAEWMPLMLTLNWIALGAGTLLYLALSPVILSRLILQRRLGAPLTVTVWINLAPPSVIALSFANLVAATPGLGPGGPLFALGLLLWGFALWWLVMAVVLTVAARRRGELPFTLAWWAFTFPLGAFVAASHRLGTAMNLVPVYYIGLTALGLLAVLWAITLAKTVSAVVTGDLLKGS